MKTKTVGIQEVARRCGVSPATVSLAFSGNRPVSDRLREKILRVARELHYEPNQWARNMLRGKTQVIGLITDALTNPFTALSVEFSEEVARSRGYQVWPAVTGRSEEQAARYLAKFRQLRVDGYIISSPCVKDEQIRELLGLGARVVAPMRDVPDLECNPVMVDFGDGMRQVLEYLHGLGHRRTALIAGPSDDLSSMARLEAYRRHTRRLGMRLDEQLIVYGDEGIGRGRREMEELLRRSRDFTAVLSTNDNMAFDAIGTLVQKGIRVPQDVSVTGYDDVPACEMWQPRLTSVSFDLRRIYEEAVTQLIDRIENGTAIRMCQIQPKLVVRDSCSKV